MSFLRGLLQPELLTGTVQIVAELLAITVAVAHKAGQPEQPFVRQTVRRIAVATERGAIQKSDVALPIGVVFVGMGVEFLLREVVNLVQILFVAPVRILILAGKLTRPGDDRTDRIAGVAGRTESSGPGFVGDVYKSFGVIVQVIFPSD